VGVWVWCAFRFEGALVRLGLTGQLMMSSTYSPSTPLLLLAKTHLQILNPQTPTPQSQLLHFQASAEGWLDGSGPTPPHRSMRVLTVPHEAVAIINGALPSAFEPGKGDIWVLEFIFLVSLAILCNWLVPGCVSGF